MTVKEAFNILEGYEFPTTFGCIDGEGESENLWDIINELEQMFPNELIYHGISKIAIVFKEESFVIKIPMPGYFVEISEEVEDIDDYYEYEYDFVPFSGGTAQSESYFNYCEVEIDNYEIAADAGFERLFARTEFFGHCGNTPIYFQEKVIPFDCPEGNRISDNYKKSPIKVSDDEFHYLPTAWNIGVIEHYGEQFAKEFERFLKENPFIADDLHNGNIGYRENGEPVILDYSGFMY